jgi:putative hydrolase of the HAD superfamily
MIDWNRIDTVFLDLDGTLLDLHFDSHFWLEHLPRRYAERRGMDVEAAKSDLIPRLKAMEGRLEWYCLDHWSREFQMDIVELKQEVAHLIAVHPFVEEFLLALRRLEKRVVLTTNAHGDSLSLKLTRTGLGRYFDAVVCAHDLGVPKEESRFWAVLQAREPFECDTTLLIDDNLAVLKSAQTFGIRYLIDVLMPNSRAPAKTPGEFPAIGDFREIMPSGR